MLTKPIRSNKGIEVAYRKAIRRLVDDLAASVEYWLTAQYRDAPPVLADDASPSVEMGRKLREVGQRWIAKFNEAAPRIAESYVRKMFRHTDSAMLRELKAAGWSVEFKMTQGVRDAFEASLAENVGLIRSIPQQYLSQVEGEVMRTYAAGRDLGTLKRNLDQIYAGAKNRTALIARDQSNKANAICERARRIELGITEAIWMHSSAGKEPRKSHVAANGKKFKVAEGCLIDGEYILPGEKINCRCTSRSVLPF